MTALFERRRSYPALRPAPPEPLRLWAVPRIRGALHLRRAGIAWMLPVLVIGACVHAWGMGTFPRWVDDPGTYLSQAWAVVYEGQLSPYSYFYDHAPAGWVQIALWALLTDGFNRYDTAIAFGNECMLIAKIVSIGLLYWLGRRLRMSRPAAAAAGLLFALSPLAVVYTRWTFLDNLVTPWILLSFALALSRRRTLGGAIGAGLAFGMAALTKETTLVLAPALLYLLIQNSDARNRAHVLVMSLGLSGLLMSGYIVYAVAKGELFPGPNHNSLLGTVFWQLSGREGSGSILDPASQVVHQVSGWLTYDPWLPLGGLAAVPLLACTRRLRPVALCLVLQTYVLVRGGYVPAMQIVNFLPWCALALPAVAEALRGNPELQPRLPRWRNRPVRRPSDPNLGRTEPIPRVPGTKSVVLRAVAVAAVVGAVLVPVAPLWATNLVAMTSVTRPSELEQATRWVAANVTRDKVLVVHDAIWTDLVQQYGFPTKDVIMAYKLDADPAVHQRLDHLDYLIVPDWYYSAQNAKYPTLIEAQKHAVPAAHFGTGPDAVTVWRVSSRWRP